MHTYIIFEGEFVMSICKFDVAQYAKTARAAVAEGVVLVQNENKVLPLLGKQKIALFGRTQLNYYKS